MLGIAYVCPALYVSYCSRHKLHHPELVQVDRLAKLMTPQTRAIVVNFPHNPTGALPSRRDWERIVDLCEGCGAYLFCDEIYRCG